MKRSNKIFIAAFMSLVMAVTFVPCFSFAAKANDDDAAAAKAQAMEKIEDADTAMDAEELESVGESATQTIIPLEEGQQATGIIRINKAYPSLSKYPSFVFTPKEDGVYTFRNVITDEIIGEEVSAYLLDGDNEICIYADCYSNPQGLGFYFQKELEADETYRLVVVADYTTDITVIANPITELESAIPIMQSVVYDDGIDCNSLYECVEFGYIDEDSQEYVLDYETNENQTITVPSGTKDPKLTYFDAYGEAHEIDITDGLDSMVIPIEAILPEAEGGQSETYNINVVHENETSMLVYVDIYSRTTFKDYAVYDPAEFDTTFSAKSTVTIKIPKKYWKKKFSMYANVPYVGSSAVLINGDSDNSVFTTFKPYKKKKIKLKVMQPNGTIRTITFKFKRK